MPPPVLDYGPPLPWHKRRRVRRAAILLAFALLILSAPWWGAPIWRHAKVLYWQRQCMNYKMPAGGIPPGTVPKEWSEFYAAMEGRPLASGGTVFLGVLRCLDGKDRLVAVDHTAATVSRGALVYRVIRPARPWASARRFDYFRPYAYGPWGGQTLVISSDGRRLKIEIRDGQSPFLDLEEFWIQDDDSYTVSIAQ